MPLMPTREQLRTEFDAAVQEINQARGGDGFIAIASGANLSRVSSTPASVTACSRQATAPLRMPAVTLGGLRPRQPRHSPIRLVSTSCLHLWELARPASHWP
jgi:hypothetical protein